MKRCRKPGNGFRRCAAGALACVIALTASGCANRSGNPAGSRSAAGSDSADAAEEVTDPASGMDLTEELTESVSSAEDAEMIRSGISGGTARDSEPAGGSGDSSSEESSGRRVTREIIEAMMLKERRKVIAEQDALKRSQKEALLRDSMLARYKSDHGGSVSGTMNIYYVCTDGTDYIAADDGSGTPSVYLACVTKDGEYFVSTEEVQDVAVSRVLTGMTDENRVSSELFWNKITLMDMPDNTIFGLTQREVDENGVMKVPYFNQGAGYYENGTWTHTDWPNTAFAVNGHTMHQAGCGFFSTAMALSYLLEDTIAPVDFKENGQYIANDGSAVTVGVVSAHLYGVPAYTTSDFDTVLQALRNGHPVMEHVGPSVFTKEGHYILLVGVLPDGSIAVNDPGHTENTYWYNHTVFPPEVILNAAKDRSTAFTVFG